MFQNPPKCWLHRQGNFITSFFPKEAKPGVDYDFFYLPPMDPQYGKPFLIAGDLIPQTQDRPEVRAVMQYFSTGERGGWLAGRRRARPAERRAARMVRQRRRGTIAAWRAEATTLRFDASDLMPGEVGSGSLWKGMTDYFSGAADLDTVLKQIDASWPKK